MAYGSRPVPDLLAYLQNETELTRSTLVRTLKDSGRLDKFFHNPQRFIDAVAAILKHELHRLLHAFAAAIAATPRQLFRGGTSISGVIVCAVPLLLESPFQGTRRVIVISGDGSNNRGRPAAGARDDAMSAGIGINVLPILALEPGLERYFSEHVIGGPGGFVIAAERYKTFAEAILKKLIHLLCS